MKDKRPYGGDPHVWVAGSVTTHKALDGNYIVDNLLSCLSAPEVVPLHPNSLERSCSCR